MTLVTPPAQIERNWQGRPYVLNPAGKRVTYTRCTTFVDCIEDKYKLQQWEKRMVALGLSLRRDLLLSVSAHRDDKDELDKITDKAKEAAEASAAATTGTALHSLAEMIDRGQELPAGLPADAVASLDAYRDATADLTAVHIERFCVQDFLEVGGTPDRVVKYEGKSYIADVKTGGIDYGALKIAMQLSVYARSKVYGITTGERTPHGAEIDRGIVIHLPAGQAKCRLYWIDLLAGWEAVGTAASVREKRRIKFPDLVTPFGPDLTTQLAASLPLDKQIEACSDRAALEAVWLAHEADWTPEHTTAAAAHLAALQEAS